MASIKNNHIISLLKSCQDNGDKTLDLSNMSLEQISNELLELDHLEYLYLAGNDLEVLPDDFFDKLTSLKWLDLRNNKLKFLPSSIGRHQELTNLLLGGNSLTRLPLELGCVSTLQGLNLSDNPIDFPSIEIRQLGIPAVLDYLKDQYIESLAQERRKKNSEIMEELKELDINDHLSDSTEQIRDDMNNFEEAVDDNLIHKVPKLKLKDDESMIGERNKDTRDKERSIKANQFNIKKTESQKSSVSNKSSIIGEENQVTVAKIKSRMQEEDRKYKHKKEEEKKDYAIQKMKDQKILREWRQEGKRLQRTKDMVAKLNPEAFEKVAVAAPYGVEKQETTSTENVAVNQLDSESKKAMLETLEERIKSHTIQLNRKTGDHHATAQQELERAEQNLKLAQQQQDELQQVKSDADYQFLSYNPVA